MRFFANADEKMRIDSSGRVLVGTSSDIADVGIVPLQVVNTGGGGLILARNDTSVSDGNDLGYIRFMGNDTTSNTYTSLGLIQCEADGTHAAGDNPTRLVFSTTADGASSLTERMRIDSSGHVGIGESSPDVKLHLKGAGSSNSSIRLENTSGTNTQQLVPGVLGVSNTGFSIYDVDNTTTTFRIDSSGNVGIGTTSPSSTLDVNGSLSKNSGSFKIDHPLPALTETHYLVHSFVEAPDASNLYAGMVDLVNGRATVNIDTAHRMTEGTFEALNTIQSWSSSNESGYAPVKCSISGNLLTIECQDATSTDTVYYEVRGIRKDQHMLDTDWTDAAGRVITEPEKVVEATEESETEAD